MKATAPVRAPRKRRRSRTRCTPSQRLVLVDLENLAGTGPAEATAGDYAFALNGLAQAIALDGSGADRVVVGVNPALAVLAHGLLPSARIVTRGGPDGADIRLCKELADVQFICRRYEVVVVASGDHFFADPIARLADHGTRTVVASVPDKLSRSLRLAAQSVVHLDVPPGTTGGCGAVVA